MKDLGRSQTRYAHAYHPYFPASPPELTMMTQRTYAQCEYNKMNFINGGLYESDGDESLPASPFSNEGDQGSVEDFSYDLNTIDFSDLFNIHKYEEDEPIRCDQLQLILDQVRHESLTSLDSLDTNYLSDSRKTSDSDFSVKEEPMYPSPTPSCVYTQLQPALSPIDSPPPLSSPQLPSQPLTPQQPMINVFECTRSEPPMKKTRRIYQNGDDNNGKMKFCVKPTRKNLHL